MQFFNLTPEKLSRERFWFFWCHDQLVQPDVTLQVKVEPGHPLESRLHRGFAFIAWLPAVLDKVQSIRVVSC